MAGPKRPCLTAGALLLLSLIAGCGSQYRTVVTPVATSGPPSQITSYAVIVTAPCSYALQTPCSAANTAENAGDVTLLNYSGDSIADQAVLGPNPVGFAFDGSATFGHVLNADNTISTFAPSTTLQTRNVELSTLPSSATPGNFLAYGSSAFYLIDVANNLVNVMPGSPPAIEQTIPVGVGPINIVGANTSQRIYAISQMVPPNTCGASASDAGLPAGQLTAIETSSNTVSNPLIPVGICPVYGVMTADGRRAFILNRGSNSISVVDSQKNILDPLHPSIPVGAGPVYAEIVPSLNLLVVANYDDNTISVIKIDLDIYGNDATDFGTVVATVRDSSLNHPASVTVLADGSRAYVANQGSGVVQPDGTTKGTISEINMTSFSVTKVLAVNGSPRTVVSAQDSIFGKVYVIAPDSKFCTIIRTDQDIVSTSILLPGYGIDARMTKVSSSLSNAIISSRLPGSGQP
jgi:DNA-binding beta-propeller fold protein YncE